MTIQKYINKNKELHSALLAFLENAEDAENRCRELIHIIRTKNYEKIKMNLSIFFYWS